MASDDPLMLLMLLMLLNHDSKRTDIPDYEER